MQSPKVVGLSAALSLISLALLNSSPAVAAGPGWYVGGNVGASSAEIDDKRIISGLLSGGFLTTSFREDDRDLGYKLFSGYQFNRNLAVEGGWFDLGEFGFEAETTPPGTFSGDIKIRGVNLDLVGFLPITARLSAFGRGGVIYAEAKDHFSGTGAVNVLDPNRKERAANYKFGGGLEYAFTESFGMRAEAERYRINDGVGNKGDVDLYSIGLIARFGVTAPDPVSAAAPSPDAITPSPQPLSPPPPLPARKVHLSADSLFDFDKSIVKPSGRQALDALAAELRATRYDLIRVTGHTDRIGAHAYNMQLSARRAEAVKDYLIESAGVPAEKISASGINGSDPVTKPGECIGSKRTAELIACLQPDRRVEVEVSGTQ